MTHVIEPKFVWPKHEAKQTKILEFKVKKGLWQGPSKKDEWLVLKRPKFLNGFQGSNFKGYIWGDGFRVYLFDWLVVW